MHIKLLSLFFLIYFVYGFDINNSLYKRNYTSDLKEKLNEILFDFSLSKLKKNCKNNFSWYIFLPTNVLSNLNLFLGISELEKISNYYFHEYLPPDFFEKEVLNLYNKTLLEFYETIKDKNNGVQIENKFFKAKAIKSNFIESNFKFLSLYKRGTFKKTQTDLGPKPDFLEPGSLYFNKIKYYLNISRYVIENDIFISTKWKKGFYKQSLGYFHNFNRYNKQVKYNFINNVDSYLTYDNPNYQYVKIPINDYFELSIFLAKQEPISDSEIYNDPLCEINETDLLNEKNFVEKSLNVSLPSFQIFSTKNLNTVKTNNLYDFIYTNLIYQLNENFDLQNEKKIEKNISEEFKVDRPFWFIFKYKFIPLVVGTIRDI